MGKSYNLTVSGLEEYVRVFAGIYRLTNSQQQVLAEFVRRTLVLKQQGKPEAEAFSAESRGVIAARLGMTTDLVSHYLKMLVRKKAVIRTGHLYAIQSIMLPPPPDDPSVTLVFSYGRKG